VAAARLTALRRAGPGRVALEVDGRPWRTVPDDVVVRTGLAAGVALERPLLRLLRRELARARALDVAGRALARRDLSERELGLRLARARVRDDVAGEVGRTLRGAGLVDDERVARSRAETLATRGWGDAAIAARLEAAGVAEGVAREALAALEPEGERARRLAEREPDARKAARRLAARGFSPESAEDALGARLD
jgi:SOS response regulatory protein OraA/RecX